MKIFNISVFLLGSALVRGDAKQCKDNAVCKRNWIRKECCSDFECNIGMCKIRCRVNSCGQKLCAKRASEFIDSYDSSGKICNFDINGAFTWPGVLSEEEELEN